MSWVSIMLIMPPLARSLSTSSTPVRAGKPEFMAVATSVRRDLLDEDGQDRGHERGQDHGRDGRLLGDGEIEDDGHGQEQEDVEAEVRLERRRG